MGGTQINQAMNSIFKSKIMEHSPKLVFFLTDGDVSDPDSVIKMVKKNSKNCRTFTIGVGNGASPYLVK